MKISPDGSSFSTGGDVDSLSERTLQDNSDSAGVQRVPSDETSFQKQMLAKLEEITAKLSELSAGKESELARCVVELVQANERLTAGNGRLTAANERLTAQVNDVLLQFARHDGTADLKNLQDSLQMASEEREELKQSVFDMIVDLSNFKEECSQLKAESRMASEEREELKQSIVTMEQEKSELIMDLSNLQESLQMASDERDELKQSAIASHQENSDVVMRLSEECAQLQSELADVKMDCLSTITGLKEEVARRTTRGPMVQPVNQYVWKGSRDASVNGSCCVDVLECPPMTVGIHKWSILMEQYASSNFVGVASTVHSFENETPLWRQEGGWVYHRYGNAFHNNSVVTRNLPRFKKGSKVTFVLDLTEDGTLSASVDGNSFHQLFSDMLSVVRAVNPEGGFVPAVRLYHSNDKVRFLGFESVSA